MPRLFTGLAIPFDIVRALAVFRGGLEGAHWIEEESYHLTLRFFGDVDGATARDLLFELSQAEGAAVAVRIESLDSFGHRRPRAIVAKAAPSQPLVALHAAQERVARRVGLAPEGRAFVPHVTLARLRGTPATAVAAYLGSSGYFAAPLRFTASEVLLYSARDSVGGGPYVVEARFALGGQPSGEDDAFRHS